MKIYDDVLVQQGTDLLERLEELQPGLSMMGPSRS